ncbi:MAG: hypothetical protein BWX50_01143 [Euryarchaeota archaeon ADurb.Bin009]|nr:MAG: hypothetical protein BWX50_01143 [Euryarchaeota archaeon ADurb.Bin009]
MEDRGVDLHTLRGVVLDVEPVRALDVDLNRRVLDGPALGIDRRKVDLCYPVVRPLREDLDEHRHTRLRDDPLHPEFVLVEEVLRAPEDPHERCLEVFAALPAHQKLLLEACERVVDVAAEGVHVGHREGAEALEPDHLALLLVPERVGRELVELHREGVRRYVHVVHDREHAETRREPEHHVAVAALEPILPLTELGGVLRDRLVAEIVHHRGLHRHTAVLEHLRKDVVGEKVADQLAPGHPAVVPDVGARFVLHELFCPHQVDVNRFDPFRPRIPEFFPDKGGEGRLLIHVGGRILALPFGGEDEELVLDLLLRRGRSLPGHDRPGELRERVALAGEREGLVPAERRPLHDEVAFPGEGLLDAPESAHRRFRRCKIGGEVGVGVDHDIGRAELPGGGDDLVRRLPDGIPDILLVDRLNRAEDGERLIESVLWDRILFGDLRLLPGFIFDMVRVDQKKSHWYPQLNR